MSHSLLRRWLLICILVGLLLVGWVTVGLATADMALGEPPGWPADSQAVALDEGECRVYLPLVQRPPEPPPWVDTQSRAASQSWYQQEYLGSASGDSGWTGNHASCGAGTTSEVFRAAMLRRINYYRSMAGVPALVGFDAAYNQKAQAAALMMSVNGRLSHSPDTSWTCYTEDGREGAGSSNLFLGVYGSAAISGYIEDFGSHNDFVGHRRWILYPQTQYMGTGDIPPQGGYWAANALWVFDRDRMWGARPETRDEFVAWPPPGYVPYQVVYSRWSFSYPKADFSQATVSMTRGGQPLAVQRNTPRDNYGENTLVWEPQVDFGNPPAGDTTYQVALSNVVIDGEPRNFTYTVIIFDPAHR